MTVGARVHCTDLLPRERLGSEAWVQTVAQAIRPRQGDHVGPVFGTDGGLKSPTAGAALKGHCVFSPILGIGGRWKDDKDESCNQGKAHLILTGEGRDML
jgi:hypothetical protein